MSDRQDPPGQETERLVGEAARLPGWGEARDASFPLEGAEKDNQSSGAIIPFEQFVRRKAASTDFSSSLSGVTGPLSSSMLTSGGLGGQMVLRGMITPMAGIEETHEEQGEQYLIFSLAGLEFGIKAEQVQTVDRLPEVTPVPNVAPWIEGVINLRGQIISVVDLRSFLGLDRQPTSPRTRLIAGRVGDLVIGLVVDGVSEMRGILPTLIQVQDMMRALPAWIAPYVNGIAAIGTRSVLLLDMERLLLSEKMHRYQRGT